MTEQLEQLVIEKITKAEQFPFFTEPEDLGEERELESEAIYETNPEKRDNTTKPALEDTSELIGEELMGMTRSREGSKVVCYIYQTPQAPDPENEEYSPLGDRHNRTNDDLMAQFGVHSEFAKEHGTYMRPFIVDERVPGQTTVTAAEDLLFAITTLDDRKEFVDLDADKFHGTGRRVGGFFCYEGLAEQRIVKALTTIGYQIRER